MRLSISVNNRATIGILDFALLIKAPVLHLRAFFAPANLIALSLGLAVGHPARIAVAAPAMGIGIAFMQMSLAPWLAGESTLARIVALGALICTGLAIYAALLHVLGVAQLRDLMTALRRPA